MPFEKDKVGGIDHRAECDSQNPKRKKKKRKKRGRDKGEEEMSRKSKDV
jgi:hypothetical protein